MRRHGISEKPNKWFKVVDFQRPSWIKNLLFIGYESGTRIGDLDRMGLLYKRRDGRFMEYKINDSGRLYLKFVRNFK